MDLFRCESILLRTHYVMIVMDHFTREIIGTAVMACCPNGTAVCRAFATVATRSGRVPNFLSTDNDPLFRFHQWRCNLSILEIEEIKTVPECPWSHPYVERAIGTVRRECLDQQLFWNAHDLHNKLGEFNCYYNEARVHSSIKATPKTEESQIRKIVMRNYTWKSYCPGLYSVPISA
ncbi:MAG: transposase [Bdellovibrionales bacterium]|nr:transposase [Oligoflexia bacterium]